MRPDNASTVRAAGRSAKVQSDRGVAEDAEAAVSALYQATAVSLIRLAYVIVGDRQGAEDIVQDAFCALYLHWHRLVSADRAGQYVRTSVLNGCRSVLRRRKAGPRRVAHEVATVSAEAVVLDGAERRDSPRCPRQWCHHALR